MGLNNINSKSTWGQAASDINTNFTTIDSDLKKVKNATTRNKGYFSSIDELKAAFSTANVGDIAYVGSAYPYQTWAWDGSAWKKKNDAGGEESVNLGDYYTKVETDEKFTETDEKLSELGQEAIVLKSYFNAVSYSVGYIKTGDVGSTTNRYIYSEHTNFLCAIVKVSEGDRFHIKGRGGIESRLWAFVDESNVVTNSSSASYNSGGDDLVASVSDKYLIVNFKIDAGIEYGLYKYSRYDDELNGIKTEMSNIFMESADPTGVGYLNTNVEIGEYVDLNVDSTISSWNYYIINVEGKATVNISECKGGKSSRLWAFLDSESNLISISNSNAQIDNIPLTLEIPTNAKTLVINNNISVKPNPIIKTASANNLEARIENLEKKLSSNVSDKQVKVLVVGNSFSIRSTAQGSANLLSLTKSLGINLYLGVIGNSGASFQTNYTKAVNDETFEYLQEGDSITGIVDKSSQPLTLGQFVSSKEWDYIILHQGSKLSGDIASFTPYLNDLIDFIKTYCTNENVKIGLMQTWAYATNEYPTTNTTPLFNAQEDMFNAICSTYKQAEKDFDVEFIIPCGTALQNARNTELGTSYNDFASSETDGVHINSYGTLITSLCVFNKVYGSKNDVKLSEIANYGNLLSDSEFEVAKECVRNAVKFPYRNK